MLIIKIFMATVVLASADLMSMEDSNKSIAHRKNMVATKFQAATKPNLIIEVLRKKIPALM